MSASDEGLFLLEEGEYLLQEFPYLLAVVDFVGGETAADTDEGALDPPLPGVDGSDVGEDAELEGKAHGGKAEAHHPTDDEFRCLALNLEELVDGFGDEHHARNESDKGRKKVH